MHPLDHAQFRFDWAKRRLEELKSVNNAYIDNESELLAGSLSSNINPQSGNPQIKFPEKPFTLIPVAFPILVGEVSYHLRSSLDYLIYELARLDSGSRQKGTQFPIYDTQNAFRNGRHRSLRGISDANADAIQLLQPFNGVQWSKWLQTISNPDKHRHLVVSDPRKAVRMRWGLTPNPPDPPQMEPGLVVMLELMNDVTNQLFYVEFHIALFIAFEDGLPVMHTLNEITIGVEKVLLDFRPKF